MSVHAGLPGPPAKRRLPARGEAVGGLSTALVTFVTEGSYGLVALAPLGPAYAPLGFALGVCAAIVGNLAAVAAGARGPLLCGPSAALSLLTATLVATLAADPRLQLADGRPDAPLVLSLVAAGVWLAALAQCAAGWLRFGRIVSYVPYPVNAGFMNAVALLMTVAMLPHALGLDAGRGLAGWRDAEPLAIAVAALALAVALRPPAWTRRVPAYLTALAAGTALHHAVAAATGGDGLGPTFGAADLAWPTEGGWRLLSGAVDWPLLLSLLPLLLGFAGAVAVTSTMQTLLAASAVDGMTQQRRDGERTLRAQGAANLAAALLGLLPTAAAVSLTSVNLRAGGRGTASRVLFALALAALLWLGSPLLAGLPMAAIAGVMLAIAWDLVDRWSRRSAALPWRALVRGARAERAQLGSWTVMLLVAAVSLAHSLVAGVAAGVLASMVAFVRSHLRPPVRAVVSGAQRSSLKIRPAAAAAALLREHGRRIAIVELQGALFFGTADAAAVALEQAAREADDLVLDFSRVGEIDASGARVLLQAAARLRAAGKRLRLAALPAGDPRRDAVLAMDLAGQLAPADFFPDADRALESAEDALLARLPAAAVPTRPLHLAETALCQGLEPAEAATLAGLFTQRRLARGSLLFRRGDPADEMVVLLQGQVAIRLPADDGAEGGRRLVSFAPGVPIGEIGLLLGQPRSADAVVEEDAVIASLAGEAWRRLAAEQPALHGKLLLAVARHLSERVRALSDELRAATGG